MVSKAGAKRSAGGSSVFVRGFDFGTTDEDFEAHMSGAGSIEKVKWVTKGSAEVTYSSPEEAAAAVEQLHKTTIEGNKRFMDVLPKKNGDRPAKRFKSGGAAQWGGMDQWSRQIMGKGWSQKTRESFMVAAMENMIQQCLAGCSFGTMLHSKVT